MENTLNLSFQGAGEVRDLFSEAGAATNKDRVRLVIEGDLTEIGEEGVSIVPDTVVKVTVVNKAEPEEDVEGDTSGDDEELPGMVVLMGKDKEKDVADA